jgi:hypothetical protein
MFEPASHMRIVALSDMHGFLPASSLGSFMNAHFMNRGDQATARSRHCLCGRRGLFGRTRDASRRLEGAHELSPRPRSRRRRRLQSGSRRDSLLRLASKPAAACGCPQTSEPCGADVSEPRSGSHAIATVGMHRSHLHVRRHSVATDCYPSVARRATARPSTIGSLRDCAFA